jgi:hypothetical protein
VRVVVDSKIPDKGASVRCKNCDNVIYLNKHKKAQNPPPLPIAKDTSQKLFEPAANYEIIDSSQTDNGTKVDVLQFPELSGANINKKDHFCCTGFKGIWGNRMIFSQLAKE